jgi:hypothetical protein
VSGFFQHLSELLGRHPFDDAFIETMRERIREHCSRVPVHVHKRQVAEARLELAAKEAIVSVFQDEFPNAIRPHTVRPDWPYAECWITDDEALIRFSFSPETDSIMGGHTLEPVRIVVQRAPPGLMKRLADSMLKQRKQAPAELPPTGTPDGRPELKLKVPAQAAQRPAPAKPSRPTPPARDKPRPR